MSCRRTGREESSSSGGERGHGERLSQFGFPSNSSQGFGIIDPLSCPFVLFEPLVIKRGDVELVDVIGSGGTIDCGNETGDWTAYSSYRNDDIVSTLILCNPV